MFVYPRVIVVGFHTETTWNSSSLAGSSSPICKPKGFDVPNIPGAGARTYHGDRARRKDCPGRFGRWDERRHWAWLRRFLPGRDFLCVSTYGWRRSPATKIYGLNVQMKHLPRTSRCGIAVWLGNPIKTNLCLVECAVLFNSEYDV